MNIKSEKLSNLLKAIRNEDITYEKLTAASKNIFRELVDINDPEVDYVLSEIESIKWIKFPTQSKRESRTVRGKVHEEIKEKLELTLKEANTCYDMRSNKLLTKVKIGGDMISGRALTDIYISYKNQSGEACVMGAYQTDGASPVIWRVRPYSKSNNDNQTNYELFDFNDHLSASSYFITLLSKIINNV